MADRGRCRPCLRRARPAGSHHHWRLYNCFAEPSDSLGKLLGRHGYSVGSNSILSADLDHVSLETCWELEHSDDVHPDSRRPLICRKPLCQAWSKRVEYMGDLSPDSHHARLRLSTWYLLRDGGATS